MVYPRPHPVPAGTGNPRGLPGIDPPNPLYSVDDDDNDDRVFQVLLSKKSSQVTTYWLLARIEELGD